MPSFQDFYFQSSTGRTSIHALKCVPDGKPRAVVQIAHGIAEHIDRYRPFMEFLADNGFVAAGNDHLGHGKSIRVPEEQGFFAEKDGWWRVVDDMDKLHDMRLSVMARAYRDQEELPAASGLSFDERLAMIVDAEWDSRRTNKRLRHLRQAGFPEQDANIADVRYDDDRKLDRAQMVELSNCSWIASRRNIIVTGASGAGKTWISNALGVAACNAFYTVRYTRLPELLDELTVFKDEEWLKQRKKYIKCDLLIIDDWLLEQVKPNEAREIMEVIEARDRTGSLILCSQFPPSAWHANLGNGAIADAVIDRVVCKSYTIHIAGEESMRKRMRGME